MVMAGAHVLNAAHVPGAAHVLDSSLFNKLTDLSELENQIFK